VLHLVEEVRVDPERRRRARVPELARDDRHLQPRILLFRTDDEAVRRIHQVCRRLA